MLYIEHYVGCEILQAFRIHLDDQIENNKNVNQLNERFSFHFAITSACNKQTQHSCCPP